MTTARTGFGRRIEAVNEMDKLTFTGCDVLQNVAKFAKSDVSNLAAPKPVHSLDIQRFQNDDVKAVGQIMRKFEEPIPALAGDSLVNAVQVVFGLCPVSRSFGLPGHCTAGFAQVFQVGLEELRRIDLFAVRQGEEGFQTEVRANDGVTQSVDFFLFCLNGKANEQLTERGALDCDRLDCAENFPTFAELVNLTPNANLVRADQLPTRLLEGKRRVLLDLAKTGTGKPLGNLPGFVLEEQLIAAINALANVLNGLCINQVPKLVLWKLLQLGNVLLHRVHVDVLPGQLEVPPMKSNAVIPDDPANVNLVMQMLILFASVQFELERFHWLISVILHPLDGLQWRSCFRRFPHKSDEASSMFLPICGVECIRLSCINRISI